MQVVLSAHSGHVRITHCVDVPSGQLMLRRSMDLLKSSAFLGFEVPGSGYLTTLSI
jgi:hypothetical protein